MKQQKFIMPVDKVVSTLQGHTIEFKAGVATHVPRECWKDVQAAGAVAEDQKAVQEEKVKVTKTVDDPVEREALMYAAYDELVTKGKRGTFTGAGVPDLKVVEKITGLDIDVKENDAVWGKYKLERKL